MQKWEYHRVIKYRYQMEGFYEWTEFHAMIEGKQANPLVVWQHLQALGEQGWELVSVTPIAYQPGRDYGGMTTQLEYMFKRPKA
jgi:hypothetical protein